MDRFLKRKVANARGVKPQPFFFSFSFVHEVSEYEERRLLAIRKTLELLRRSSFVSIHYNDVVACIPRRLIEPAFSFPPREKRVKPFYPPSRVETASSIIEELGNKGSYPKKCNLSSNKKGLSSNKRHLSPDKRLIL